MVIVPQLPMFTGCGATKSLTSAVKEGEERLFRKALAKAVHVPVENTPAAVRLTAASPKVPTGRVMGALESIVSVTVVELTAPSAKPAALRSTRLPQQGSEGLEMHWPVAAPLVTHLSKPNTGVAPPLVKSKVIRRSPAVRVSVIGPVAALVNPGVGCWL